MERKVLINDLDKLKKLGFKDGYEKAVKLIQEDPSKLDLLNSVNIPFYYEAFFQGVESAKSQYGIVSENNQQKK